MNPNLPPFWLSRTGQNGVKTIFFVGQTRKIECNFTTKFIGFTKYTAMKTILLIRLACYIYMANHSQLGTSLRSPKLWFICVKHVINSGVQPLRRHSSTKLVSLISRSVPSMCRKFGKDCPTSCWNIKKLLYLFWNQEVSSVGLQTTADDSLGACKENLIKSLIKKSDTENAQYFSKLLPLPKKDSLCTHLLVNCGK